jgi:hypothetical protein
VDEEITIAIAQLRAASRRRSALAHGTSEFDAAVEMEELAARRVREVARRADDAQATARQANQHGSAAAHTATQHGTAHQASAPTARTDRR